VRLLAIRHVEAKNSGSVFGTTEEILIAIRNDWSEVTFEDLQSVFFDWIQRVEYDIDHEGEYYVNGQ
jgi:hypothetical protein